MTLVFKLTRPARKLGGDRYEADVDGEAKPMVIYVPQSISRSANRKVVAETIDVAFNVR